MAYKRNTLDLTAVIAPENRKKIVDRDAKITEIFVTKAVGSFQIHFGPDGDAIDIDAPISFKPSGDEQRRGLYYSNNLAQVGVNNQIVYTAFGGELGANPEQ